MEVLVGLYALCKYGSGAPVNTIWKFFPHQTRKGLKMKVPPIDKTGNAPTKKAKKLLNPRLSSTFF